MTLKPADHLVVANADAEHHAITQVEDTPLVTPAEVRVLASSSSTWKSGPSAACTLSALGAVAGFIGSQIVGWVER